MEDLTAILNGLRPEERGSTNDILPIVYRELRALAAVRMAALPPGQTLQPTALVHEAYLRLVRPSPDPKHWDGRGHFFAAAAEAMRRILVEGARKRATLKRSSGLKRVDLESVEIAADSPSELVVALDAIITRLATRDPKSAELVKLRFFAGFSHEEAADLLAIPDRTAKRMWAFTRAWMLNELRKEALA